MARTLVDGHGTTHHLRQDLGHRPVQPALRLLHAGGPEVPAAPAPDDARGDPARRAAPRDFGIEKIRLTGGEPTTRPDLVGIVRDLSAIGFPAGIALSTNGVLFPRMAHDLLAAGLTKVNVSLDAAEAEHFRKMTRRDHYAPVRESIDLALSLPFDSVKVNAVVIRGFNDDQILPLAAMTREKTLGVRFIEFMPFGDNEWKDDGLDRLAEVRDRLAAAGYVLTPIEKTLVAGPADEYAVRSPRGAHRGRSASSRRSRTASATPATGCA